MRAAAHLDPQLSAENVVGTLKAAKLYMIESLVTLCTHYIVNIKPEEVLRVMTSARATAYQNALYICTSERLHEGPQREEKLSGNFS